MAKKKYLDDTKPNNTIDVNKIKTSNLSDKFYHLSDKLGIGSKNDYQHMYDDLSRFGLLQKTESNGNVSYTADPTLVISSKLSYAGKVAKGLGKQLYYKIIKGQNYAARNVASKTQNKIRQAVSTGINETKDFFNSDAYKQRLRDAYEYMVGGNKSLRKLASKNPTYIKDNVGSVLQDVNADLDNIRRLKIRTIKQPNSPVRGSMQRNTNGPHTMSIYRKPYNTPTDFRSTAKHEAIHSTFRDIFRDLNEGLRGTVQNSKYLSGLDEQRARVLNVLSDLYKEGKDITKITYNDVIDFYNRTKNLNAQDLINNFDRNYINKAFKYMVGGSGAAYIANENIE